MQIRNIINKLIIILLLSVNSFIFSHNIIYESQITDKGPWGYFIGVKNRGPYFIDNDHIVYINHKNTLIISNLDGKIEFSKKLSSQKSLLFKGYKDIYIKDLKLYKLTNNKLEIVSDDIPITDEIYYDFTGLYKIDESNNKKYILKSDIIYFDKLLQFPQVDPKEKNIFFVTQKRAHSISGTLYKYSLEDKISVSVKEKVIDFSFLSDDKILSYVTNSPNTILKLNSFPSDFILYDIQTTKELFNSDIISHSNNYEFSINSFDSNSEDLIVAFGGLEFPRFARQII